MKEPPYPIVFYLVLLAGALVLFREAYRIEGLGSLSGPGTFPMIAASLMILCLVSLIIRQALAGRTPDEDSTSQRLHRIVTWPILAYIAVCAIYVATLEYAGFWISSAVFLFVSFYALQIGRAHV